MAQPALLLLLLLLLLRLRLRWLGLLGRWSHWSRHIGSSRHSVFGMYSCVSL